MKENSDIYAAQLENEMLETKITSLPFIWETYSYVKVDVLSSYMYEYVHCTCTCYALLHCYQIKLGYEYSTPKNTNDTRWQKLRQLRGNARRRKVENTTRVQKFAAAKHLRSVLFCSVLFTYFLYLRRKNSKENRTPRLLSPIHLQWRPVLQTLFTYNENSCKWLDLPSVIHTRIIQCIENSQTSLWIRMPLKCIKLKMKKAPKCCRKIPTLYAYTCSVRRTTYYYVQHEKGPLNYMLRTNCCV